jgi:hypothetical protein
MIRCIDEMSVFELARWYSLVEAVNIISEECEDRGINFNKIKLPPLVIEKYIENTCDIFAQKIIDEKNKKHKDDNINEYDNLVISAQNIIGYKKPNTPHYNPTLMHQII